MNACCFVLGFHFNIFFFSVSATMQATKEQTQEKAIAYKMMTYVSLSIAFILLLILCCVVGFLCYRRLHHKREKRLIIAFRTYASNDKK